MLLISDNNDSNILYPTYPSYLTYLSYPSYPSYDIPVNGFNMFYIRNKTLEFIANSSGYWGNHDCGLERAIRTPKETSIFLGGASEKLISMIASGQLLLNWKMSNLRGSTEDLLHFAKGFIERSTNGSTADLVNAAITSYGHGFTSMNPRILGQLVLPSEASIQRIVPIDVGMSRVALNDAHLLRSNMSNDARVLVPSMSTNPHGLMPNMSFNNAHFLRPNTLNDAHLVPNMSSNMSMEPPNLSNKRNISDETSKPDMYYNMTRFRKEAKNTFGRFSALGASFVDIERFPSTMAKRSTSRMEEDDSLSTVSSMDESLIHTANYPVSFSNQPRDDGKFDFSNKEFRPSICNSDTESDGASRDSDYILPKSSSSSTVVRRVKRKLEDKPADESGPGQQTAPVYRIAAKGIQITPVGTFRVQLNKTRNSSRKFTKNVSDLVEALWLFEIAVLICDKPSELSSLLKSGNYQYLLEKNYIRDIDEYKSKLGEYILLLHKKKILKSEFAEAAVATFSNLAVNEEQVVVSNLAVNEEQVVVSNLTVNEEQVVASNLTVNEEQVVDPIDLHNLLSLRG